MNIKEKREKATEMLSLSMEYMGIPESEIEEEVEKLTEKELNNFIESEE